jgi:adenine-specific DNA-methyltransferase
VLQEAYEVTEGVADGEASEIFRSVGNFDQRAFLLRLQELTLLLRNKKTAAAIVMAVLKAWFRRSFPKLDTSSLPVPAVLDGHRSIESFANALSNESLLDAAYWLSSAYAKLLTVDRRKALSMYFTPPLLANRVLDDLESSGVAFGKASFLDPACGGSAFLVPIAHRMRQKLLGRMPAQQMLDHVRLHLCGMDLDETLCELSKQFLRAVFYHEIQLSGREAEFSITPGNSLVANHFHDAIDVVVCNPPYRKMTSTEVDVIREDFADVIGPQPNLYGVFIALCTRFLRRGGMCAVVTPTSYLSGHSFEKLRAELVKNTQVLSLGILSARHGVFMDVQQETAVSLLVRSASGYSNGRTAVSIVSPFGKVQPIGTCALPKGGAAWPIPREASDVELISRASMLTHRIVDYGYRIRVGNYVWNRDARTAYSSERIARRFNRKTSVPLLWSSDIKVGKAVKYDGLKRANGERRVVAFDSEDNPSIIRRPCILMQRVTSNDQSRRLVAATVPESLFRKYGGFVGENHTIIIEPSTSRPLLSPTKMCALLGCAEIDRLYRCISGATNVSVFELGQLPLPDPRDVQREIEGGSTVESAVRRLMREP